MNPEDWDRCLEICLTGQFNCTRLAVPLLRQSKNASIVNISSAAGRLGFAMRTPYAAAKWGVIGFTKSLSIELGPDNIRVNAILPGLVAGDRQRRVLEAKAQQRGISYAEMETHGVLLHLDQGLRDAGAARRPDPVHVQPARQDDFRAGDLDLRRYADAGIDRQPPICDWLLRQPPVILPQRAILTGRQKTAVRFLRGCPVNVAAFCRTAFAIAFLGCTTFVVGPAALAQSHAALSGYNADITQSSISGISSGGFMAVQFGTAWSSVIRGVGIVAGGPFWCAQTDANDAFDAFSLPFINATGLCLSGQPLADLDRFVGKADAEVRVRPYRSRARAEPAEDLCLPRLQRRHGGEVGHRCDGRVLSPLPGRSQPRQPLLPGVDRGGSFIRGCDRSPQRRSQRVQRHRHPVHRCVRLRSGGDHPAAHLRAVERAQPRLVERHRQALRPVAFTPNPGITVR